MTTLPLHLIEHATRMGMHLELFSPIKTGKEAMVISGQLNGRDVAVKYYTPREERTFRSVDAYLAGKHMKHGTHRKAVAKNTHFAKRLLHDNWVKREYFLLSRLFTQGIPVPEPLLRIEHSIIMELLAVDGIAAPRLSDVTLPPERLEYALRQLLETICQMWSMGIVHGDLSPFNVLWWKERPFLIDFPQALDVRTSPLASAYLRRDVEQIAEYGSRHLGWEQECVIEESLARCFAERTPTGDVL